MERMGSARRIHLHLGLPKGLLSSEFLIVILNFPMRAIYSAHLILHDMSMLILLQENKRSYQSESVIREEFWTVRQASLQGCEVKF
jgi:hypothetical protein